MTRSNLRGWWLVVALAVNLVVPWSLARAEEDHPFGAEPTRPAAAASSDDPFGAEPARPTAGAQSDEPFAASRRIAARRAVLAVAITADVDAASEAKIRAELGNATTMEFIETPLTDAVDYLKDLHRIEMQLDEKGLEDSGLGSDTPITHSSKGISLGSALRQMLWRVGATYIVHDGVLLISTPDALDRMVELRVYNVRELLRPSVDADDLVETLALVEAQVVPYLDLLVVRASIVQHELIDDLLGTMHEKLDSKAN